MHNIFSPAIYKQCKTLSWQITYQEEYFASDFLENTLVILQLRLSFYLSLRQDLQEMEESISITNIHDQTKICMEICTPCTSDDYL